MGPPLRAGPCLAKGSRLQARARPARHAQGCGLHAGTERQVARAGGAARGRGARAGSTLTLPAECEANCAHHSPVRLSWAKLLKRVFEIDLEHCPNCGGELKIIAAILEAPVIEKILTHLGLRPARPGTASGAGPWPGAASGLTLPNRDRSCDPAPRAAGFGCVRLRPRVRGTDSSGLAARDNPQEAPKKDEFRRRCQRPTDRSRLRRQIQARQVSCSVVFRGAVGKEKGRLKSLSSSSSLLRCPASNSTACAPPTCPSNGGWIASASTAACRADRPLAKSACKS